MHKKAKSKYKCVGHSNLKVIQKANNDFQDHKKIKDKDKEVNKTINDNGN